MSYSTQQGVTFSFVSFSSQFLSLSFVGELVGNRGSKMPYAKIQQLGILFNNLPLDLKKEIGVIPRKPSLRGSG